MAAENHIARLIRERDETQAQLRNVREALTDLEFIFTSSEFGGARLRLRARAHGHAAQNRGRAFPRNFPNMKSETRRSSRVAPSCGA